MREGASGGRLAVQHARDIHRAEERLPSPAELLPGLAVGDVRAVSADLDAAMKASGLSHLTAVSGESCGLGFAALPCRMLKQSGFSEGTQFPLLLSKR